MAENDLIGVVTVTYNSSSVLADFLQCVSEQTHHNFLLFAVDNASSDETVSILRRSSDHRLRIIANPDNRGVAEGNNQGIRAALQSGCTAVLLLNNDTEFGHDLFAKLLDGLVLNSVEMTCPKMLYHDEPNRIWAAGGTFHSWLGFRSSHFGEDELDHGQYDKPRLVTYVPTCCVLIQKLVFEKVGLMDARYFVYMDDVDFMYRAMKKGVKLMYLPDTLLYHKIGRLTGGEESPFNVRYNNRNRVFFLIKHFGLLRSIPMLLLNQIVYARRLLSGKLSLRVYWMKQKAVREGIMLSLRKNTNHADICPQ